MTNNNRKMRTHHILSLMLLALFSCGETNDTQEQVNTVHVRVQEAKEHTVQFPIRSSGRLATNSEQKLAFRTGGIISRIHVSGGQSVKQGQTLAELNLREIQAQVNMAREQLQKAERDFNRVQNLYNDSVATLATLQDAQTALSVAKSSMEIAEFNLRYSRIEATTDGRIMRVLMEENEIAAPGYPVILFGSTQQQWVVRVNVSDRDLVLITLGDSATISLDPYPNHLFNGVVSEIAGMADPYTGTYEVEITLKGAQGKNISSGMIARVEIIPLRVEKLIAVHADAIFSIIERKGYVYVIKDSTAQKRKVSIERIADPYIYITGDIEPSDLVVTKGMNFINGQSKVMIEE